MEDEFLQFASAHQTRVAGGFDARHMVSFIKGMAQFANFEVRAELHGGKTLEIELDEELVGEWAEFGRRSVVRLTADHSRATSDPSLVPMDFEASFVRDLAELAQDRLKFDGLYGEAAISSETDDDVVAVHQVRWQGLSGEMLEEELIAMTGQPDEAKELQHDDFADLLLRPLNSAQTSDAKNEDRKIAMSFGPAVETLIAKKAEADRQPSSVVMAAALRRAH
jgi:hypothetical protein